MERLGMLACRGVFRFPGGRPRSLKRSRIKDKKSSKYTDPEFICSVIPCKALPEP